MELFFHGMLHRLKLVKWEGYPVLDNLLFCLVGIVGRQLGHLF